MRINVYLYPAIVLAVFLGTIQLSTLTPYWNTSARAPGSPTVVEAGEGDSIVLVDTADIRGSWTLGDAAATFQVPAAEIKAHFGLPSDLPDSAPIKDLKQHNPEFETSALRDWLKARSPVAKK